MVHSTDLRVLRLLLLSALGLQGCGDKDDEDDGSGTDSGGTSVVASCVDPVDILDPAGLPTGFVRCDDGAVDRVAARDWDPTITGERCAGKELERACEVDADCTDSAHGACLTVTYEGGFGDACQCSYSCATDTDCDPGQLCVGPGVTGGVTAWPVCVAASCETGDDCASGECGIESWDDGCGWSVDLLCRSDADECRSDADCDEACGLGWDGDVFACQEANCTPGRPLRVEGVARTAPVAAGSAWLAHQAPVIPADDEDRRTLARHWSLIGALEHASIGSFARFSLELMALGAPPDLLIAAQQALADEVEHARLAFGLASAYAGRALGPGPLDLSGVELLSDPEQILTGLIEDACVNETLAAAEARFAAEGCADPVVRRALLQIASDEARHAALGWRTLRWLLTTRPELRASADQALQRTIAAVSDRSPSDGSDLATLGKPTSHRCHQVHQATLCEVVQPCFDALMVDLATLSEPRSHTTSPSSYTVASAAGA